MSFLATLKGIMRVPTLKIKALWCIKTLEYIITLPTTQCTIYYIIHYTVYNILHYPLHSVQSQKTRILQNLCCGKLKSHIMRIVTFKHTQAFVRL